MWAAAEAHTPSGQPSLERIAGDTEKPQAMQHAHPPFGACVGLSRQAYLHRQTQHVHRSSRQVQKKGPNLNSNSGSRCLHAALALAGAQADRSIAGLLCAHGQIADKGTHESIDIAFMEHAADSQA